MTELARRPDLKSARVGQRTEEEIVNLNAKDWGSQAAKVASDVAHRVDGVVRSKDVHVAAKSAAQDLAKAAKPAAANLSKTIRDAWTNAR
jgi:hypothetical protein